jgi:hypothetical protein
MKKILFLLVLKIVLRAAPMLAADNGIKIGVLPLTTNANNTGYIPIVQPYPGRTTNDTFRISVTNLFRGRMGPTVSTDAGYVPYWDGEDFLTSPWRFVSTNHLGFGTDTNLFFYADNIDDGNLGIGFGALHQIDLSLFASGNTTIGAEAGERITSGSNNSVLGQRAGWNITGGNQNVLIGSGAAPVLSNGDGNTGIGTSTLFALQTGVNNTAIGIGTFSHVLGNYNTGIGGNTGNAVLPTANGGITNGIGNTFLGYSATSARNITNGMALGAYAVVTNSNEIVIGNATNTLIFLPTPVIPLHTPASSAETNYAGAVTWDADYIYVWTSSTVNKRAALLPW